ncbi:MAG: cytochrome c [Candidatus Methylacidiphilales bacterium]
MDRQQKVKYQTHSEFFADGRAARMPVPGTLAIEMPARETYFTSGKLGQNWGAGFPDKNDLTGQPFQITRQDLLRGQERYLIYCKPCHGTLGDANGFTSKFGLQGIANLHQEKFVKMDEGEIFNTITHGKGLMQSYGASISIEDRWKIIAYVRVLQRSQNARIQDVPESQRGSLKPAGAAPAPAPAPAPAASATPAVPSTSVSFVP